jgi:beta-lactamase regulating signal transducer with metallopeptidase domain
MSPMAYAITAALMQSLWQDAVIAVGCALLLALLRGRSAHARYAVACAGLVLMVAVPLATAAAFYVDAGAGRALGGTAPAGAPALLRNTTMPMPEAWLGGAAARGAWMSWLEQWVFPIWTIGVLAGSLRIVSGGAHAAVVARSWQPADQALTAMVTRVAGRMGLRRTVRIGISTLLDDPATLGAWRPLILLPPAAAMGLTPQQLEAVLAHELAHIRRHDYAVNVVQMVAETLLFYHPAVWWISRRIRFERELCCDAAAVQVCGDVFGYAHALTTLARMRVAVPRLAMSAGGHLVRRVERLLGSPAGDRRPPAWRMVGAAALVFVSGALSTDWLRVQSMGRPPAGAAEITGQVFDPFGVPVDGVLMYLESAAHERPFFARVRTDHTGRFTFERLPAARYVLTAPMDFVSASDVAVAAGARVDQDVRMALEPFVDRFMVCAACPLTGDVYVPPDSLVKEFERDRQEGWYQTVTGAEPAGGWEFYRPPITVYPAALRDAGIQGTVVLEGRIGADGFAQGLRAAASAHPLLASVAISELQHQRWQPARVRGVPVDVPLRITIDFNLAAP